MKFRGIKGGFSGEIFGKEKEKEKRKGKERKGEKIREENGRENWRGLIRVDGNKLEMGICINASPNLNAWRVQVNAR